MKAFLDITAALSDPTRVRALLALREGELCLCQVIDLLGLAPSTVSKHMDLLHNAGLVERRKEGRWMYFRLPGKHAAPAVKGVLRWAFEALKDEELLEADAKQVCCVRRKGLEEVSACYRAN
jgi:ArsR family transcriptional regulator